MVHPRSSTRRQFTKATGAAGAMMLAGMPSTNLTAAAVLQQPSEWNIVTNFPTGGADPFSEYPSNSQYVLPWHVMEPLFYPALAEDGKSWTLVNELATDWELTDPQTLTVALEEGVMFQNGEELTAEHVKVAYDTMVTADPPTRRTAVLKPLGEAEVVDTYTIRWHMPEPNISVLGVMYQLLIPPLARQDMTAEEFEREPIGTGPYRVVSWPLDGVVELEAWEDYRRGKVTPDRIIGREVPDASTRLYELISGNAQIAQGITTDAIAELEMNDQYELTSLRGSTLTAQVINVYKSDPLLRDKRVRQALSYAINRELIIETILEGQAQILPTPFGPGWLGHAADHEPYPYDPEKARQLLQEAGAEGLTFNWMVTQQPTRILDFAQAAASQLADVGVTANIELVETARLLADRNEGNYDIMNLSYGITWLPSTILQFTLGASFPDDKLSAEWGDTPEELTRARELYETAKAAPDLAGLESGLQELHEHMHEEALWLSTYSSDDLWGIDKSTGFRPFPTVYFRWYDEWSRRGMTAPQEPRVPLIGK